METFRDKVDSDHTALIEHSSTYAAQAAAPLAAVLSQLKLYVKQSKSAEDASLEISRINLAEFTKAAAAPHISALAALVTQSPGWPRRIDPPLVVGSIKYAAACKAFEDALAYAAVASHPRKAVCEADVPLSKLVRNADAFELGTADLCGVRFSFRARRGCNCVASPLITSSRNVEGNNTRDPCGCGIVCEATASPVWEALSALYDAFGKHARAVDNLISTEDFIDEKDDDDNKHSDGGVSCVDGSNTDTSKASTDNKSGNKNMSGKKKNRNSAANTPIVKSELAPIDLSKRSSQRSFVTVESTFGRVDVTFSVRTATSETSDKSNESSETGALWLTADKNNNVNKDKSEDASDACKSKQWYDVHNHVTREDKQTVKVTLSLPHAVVRKKTNNNGNYSNANTHTPNAVHVRCTVSFPDVVQQAHALQLCVDAIAAEEATVKERLEAAEAASAERVQAAEAAGEAAEREREQARAAKIASEDAEAEEAKRKREAALAVHDAEMVREWRKDLQRKKGEEADLRKFTQGIEWEAAFNAHIACCLEEEGYPRLVSYNAQTGYYDSAVAPARINGAPTEAVLSLLQSKARARIQDHILTEIGAEHANSDVMLTSSLYNSNDGEHNTYYTRIRLNDDSYPSHAAYFRAACQASTLGTFVHSCFVPLLYSASSLPFVTLYHPNDEVPCATSLALPETDIVYGEYNEYNSAITYPVGTVLMYPRAVVSDGVNGEPTYNTPWFITFEPCASSMLRGAVPVGRVMSCQAESSTSNVDNMSQPFDETALNCFQSSCSAGSCYKNCDNTYSSFVYSSFESK